MKIIFEKYQANGNDYILIDCIENAINFSCDQKKQLAKEWCIRNYSIGADDVIFIKKSKFADVKIAIIEPDGSEADMCGNGIRCVAAYIMKKQGNQYLKIETLAGIKEVRFENDLYRVNMGQINMDSAFFKDRYLNFESNQDLFNIELDYPQIGKKEGSIIYTGEPNIVFITNDIENVDLNDWGKNISLNKDYFPKGICTVIVENIGLGKIKARFFEKGVYKETNACGTGSTAAAYIAKHLLKLENKRIAVNMKGGIIYVEPGNINQDTFMIGEAKKVYSGFIEI
jgi:diaminopimelate epimerase